jgi:hypothetical protein
MHQFHLIMATPDDLIGAPDRPSKVPDGSDGSNWLLNDAQITGIERRLRLTREQAPYWPAVAAALRDVAGQLCQQPAGAAVDRGRPFLQQLRDDQKREVRELVRMIGLGTVSSHI